MSMYINRINVKVNKKNRELKCKYLFDFVINFIYLINKQKSSVRVINPKLNKNFLFLI